MKHANKIVKNRKIIEKQKITFFFMSKIKLLMSKGVLCSIRHTDRQTDRHESEYYTEVKLTS